MGKDQELLEAARSGNIAVVEKILGQRAKRSGPLARWVKQQISCQKRLFCGNKQVRRLSFVIKSVGGRFQALVLSEIRLFALLNLGFCSTCRRGELMEFFGALSLFTSV